MKLSKEYEEYYESFVFITKQPEGLCIYKKDEFVNLVQSVRNNLEDFNLEKEELDEYLNTQVYDSFIDKEGNFLNYQNTII